MSYVVSATHQRESRSARISEHESCQEALDAMAVAINSGAFEPWSVGVSTLEGRVFEELIRKVADHEETLDRLFGEAELATILSPECSKTASLWQRVANVQDRFERAQRELAEHRKISGL